MLKFAFFIVTAIAILFALGVAFMVFTDDANSFSKKMWFYTAKCDAFPTFQNATEIAQKYKSEITNVLLPKVEAAIEDVYKKLIDNFVTAVQKSDTEAVAHEKYVVEVIDRLKAVKKEDLIKYFVTKELTPIIEEHKNNRNLNVEAKPVGDRGKELKDSVTLKINFGKNHRFDIKALFSLINSSPKLRGMDIGQINLMSEYSVFAVESKYVIEAIRSLTGVQFNGKKIRVSKSDEPISQVRSQYSRSSGGGENRGGGGYRGGGSGRRRWSNKGDSSISAPWAKKKNFGKSRRKR